LMECGSLVGVFGEVFNLMMSNLEALLVHEYIWQHHSDMKLHTILADSGAVDILGCSNHKKIDTVVATAALNIIVADVRKLDTQINRKGLGATTSTSVDRHLCSGLFNVVSGVVVSTRCFFLVSCFTFTAFTLLFVFVFGSFVVPVFLLLILSCGSS
jgi:hypothetical protein